MLHDPTSPSDDPGTRTATGPAERRLITSDELATLRAAADLPTTTAGTITDPTG